MGKRAMAFALVIFCVAVIFACGRREGAAKDGRRYTIYYVNQEGTGVISENYVTDTPAEDKEALLQELMELLRNSVQKPGYLSPLSGAYQGYALNEGQMNLDFGPAYLEQNPILEVLGRAAVVRTLTQIDGIDTITFSVQNETLTDDVGVPVGVMTADSFIDNAGREINAYAETEFSLYFANEAGNALTKVKRSVVYNSNISMERQVVEELIKGPQKGGDGGDEPGRPTINPAVAVLNVTVKDRVCYVDLSKEFLMPVYEVTSQTVLYSIVNSLVELSGVSRVQISVDGSSEVTYRDSVSLTTMFERNLDLVE